MELDPSLQAPMPERVLPMLPMLLEGPTINPTLVRRVFFNDEWVFEPKFDGYRCMARIVEDQVVLLNKEGRPFAQNYPQITQALGELHHNAILDGEILVTIGEKQGELYALRRALRAGEALKYYVFDMPYIDGYDIRSIPMEERKTLLKDTLAELPEGSPVQYCAPFDDKFGLLAEVLDRNLEGIVAKRKNSRYQGGLRNEWVKMKLYNRRGFNRVSSSTEWATFFDQGAA